MLIMNKCEDCIHYELCQHNSRQEAHYFGKDKEIYITIKNNTACKFFKRKTETADIKHGKWLKTDAYPHRVYCSLCFKTYVTNEEAIQGRDWQHPVYCTEAEYCPHCGARMDI